MTRSPDASTPKRSAPRKDLNDARVDARRDDKVILKLALVPVVDDVHAMINPTLDNLPIVGNIRAPLRRQAPQEIVALARQLVRCCEAGRCVCAHHLQTQRRGTLGMFAAESQDGLARGQNSA